MAGETFSEHARILKAIAAGEPDEASAAMVAHLTTARDRILATMQ